MKLTSLKADAEGRACYLESSHGHNVPFYNKRGYYITRKVYLCRGDKPVALDIMVREPQTQKSKYKTAVVTAETVVKK
jgi:hypothetical protein